MTEEKKVKEPSEEVIEGIARKRLEALGIKYGANQIYAVEKLPMPGWIYEFINQMVIVSYVEEGKMNSVMVSSVKPKPIDNSFIVKVFDKNSNEIELTVDILGAGNDPEGKQIRLFPASYAQFISETTIFHRDTLKRAWDKCKQISKTDFKSYSSDSGNALLNTTDNVGLIVKVKDDDFLYIRITRVVWDNKEKTFSIFHGSEEIKFHTFPGKEFKFQENGESEFTNVQFKMNGLMNEYSKIFKFEGLKCKVIDLKDMCV
jgi:hypothetical protein